MTRVDVALALVVRAGRVLLQRRDLHDPVMPGLWEFPGGKLEAGEPPGSAAIRELREETGLEGGDPRAFPPIAFDYPDRCVVLHPFRTAAEGVPRTGLAWGWFRPEEAERLRQPEANRLLAPLVARICRDLP